MDKNTRDIMFSSESDEYETPKWLFDVLDNIFHFTLDPAASHLSHLCEHYYTLSDSGLDKDWDNEVWFINPPYSNSGTWADRASIEFVSGNSGGVMLLAARTETKYWHGSIWPIAHYVLFLNKRLRFANRVKDGGDKPSSAPYPSVVVMYTNTSMNEENMDVLKKYGYLVDLWKQ